MWAPIYTTICVCFLVECATNVFASPWANPSQELLDEVNDAEIYKAVVNSMNEWERRKKVKEHNPRIKREDTSVCYADLGCFESSGPFGYLDMLPNTPEEISTKFLLYPVRSNRRRSGAEPTEIPFSNISDAFAWSKKGFNNSLSTKVMIHGFGSDCTHVWVYEMRSALMTVEDVNVICVDWANGATLPNYVKASANTRLVGKQLSMFIKGLVNEIGLRLDKMHLIGFSLGAHVAGFAGAELRNLSRITGLDPAGPLFESQDPRARLDQTDAKFVDVIHSNGENLILGGLGSWQPMGNVDFYPNGGRMQKGCTNLFLGAVTDIIWSTAVEGRSLCNHRRAYKFFTDSIHPRCHFPAFPCDSYEDYLAGKCFPCNEERKCGNMGYYADRAKGTGQLYLITRDEEPFCAHQYLIKIESSPTEVPIISYGRIQVTLIGDTLLNETFTLTKKEDEEIKLGESISRIIVPHPILLPPTNIQVMYIPYSGWLTSGLLQWKIDKISLSDSYGKSLSVCKKNLILDSGIPVVLPLYPGDCNLPSVDKEIEAEDRHDDIDKSKFVTNIVETNKNSSTQKLNIPWTSDKENAVDSERESSRAFNTRAVELLAPQDLNDTHEVSGSDIVREVVEPILKPQPTKNGRSHDPDKDKPEITEPILGPTTSRYSTTTASVNDNNKEVTYNFYDIEKENEWSPGANADSQKHGEKWKREDESTPVGVKHSKPQRNIVENGFEAIVKTVQFLPQRIARMIEDAEKYARDTILPFVSTYTPRFISDIINPRERSKPKYVPLNYEESTKKAATTRRMVSTTTQKTTTVGEDEASNRISSTEDVDGKKKTATPRTHIQKIKKKGENVSLVFPENMETTAQMFWTELGKNIQADARSVREKKESKKEHFEGEKGKEIYIDLPVFEEDYKTIKYIPLLHN